MCDQFAWWAKEGELFQVFSSFMRVFNLLKSFYYDRGAVSVGVGSGGVVLC